MIARRRLVLLCVVSLAACTLKDESLAQPPDAIVTPSGLASKVLRVGLGTSRPTATSIVTVHYTGWTPDGREFDSSHRQGQPMSFPLNQVIPGWTEGVQLMVKGEKRRFWIPGRLAYDSDPRPETPKGLLIFDVELLDFR